MTTSRLFALTFEPSRDECSTPPWIFDALGLTFDLDVCAPPGGIHWVPAIRYLTITEDGLTAPWTGRVWMNPPYSHPAPWLNRFIEHRHGIALIIHAKSAACRRLWADADGWVMVPPVRFGGHSNDLPYPLSMAAYGAECVDAIARVGPVRRLE